MNKKVVVLVVLGTIQSAHAFWKELFQYIPALKNISAVLAVSQKNRQPRIQSSITVLKESLPLDQPTEMDVTTAQRLQIKANIAGNYTIEPHDKPTIIVQPKLKTSSKDAVPNISYTLEQIDDGKIFLLKSDDNTVIPNQKPSFWSFLWSKKTQPEPMSANSLDFIIKIPKNFKQLTYDSIGEGNFNLTSPDVLKITCICSLKKKGNILFNRIQGAIDATTGSGSVTATNICGLLALKTGSGAITVSQWTLPQNRKTNNTIEASMGMVKVELPDNISVITKDSTNVFYNQKAYKPNQPIKKGSGLHELTVTTLGKIELD